jgi:two-component system, sensor histidine kinase and response regulator
MSLIPDNYCNPLAVSKRAASLLQEHQQTTYKRIDRSFAGLLIFQWLAAILIALLVSPLTWAGQFKQTHIHVWTAIFLGGLIITWPVFLALKQPGRKLTRHVIAVSQMLFSALLVHLTGGRIETHFHIFGSLAFLATYCDWQVLISASLVVACDHFLGGLFWPQSVYGVLSVEPWRWLEHSGWVVFEDIFLARSCCESVKDMQVVALRQAEVEDTRQSVEETVAKRTEQLRSSETRLSTQYAVTRALAEAETFERAVPEILREIGSQMLGQYGTVYGALWENDTITGKLSCNDWLLISNNEPGLKPLTEAQALAESKLPADVWETGMLSRVLEHRNSQQPDKATSASLYSAFAFPILAEDKIVAVVEFLTQKPCRLLPEELTMVNSLGEQIGQLSVRKNIEVTNRELANIVQCSGVAIFGSNLDGIITSWNTGAETLLGYSQDELKGKNISLLVPSEKRDEYSDLRQRNRQGQLIENLETLRQRKDGTLVEVSLTRAPVLDQSGRIIGVSCIARDITERKQAEKRVSEFYSCVSHELRTPLTAIRGALGLIEGKVVQPDSEKARQLISMARTSADRLIRLINDILDLKKLEIGKMELKWEEINPAFLITETLDNLFGLAEESGIKLVQEMHANAALYADRDLMIQVLTNLVSNAIKF